MFSQDCLCPATFWSHPCHAMPLLTKSQ
jgi:hypothetical protein